MRLTGKKRPGDSRKGLIMAHRKVLKKAAAGLPSGAGKVFTTSRTASVKAPDADHNPELNEVDREIIGALAGFRDTLRARAPLGSKYTVRQVVGVLPPPPFGPDDVRRTREELGVSQPVFAGFLGTSTSTIRSWEQGQKSPSPMARRLLSLIADDPVYWKSRFSAMAEIRDGGE
jgi:putative transcriptional regulator